MAEKIPHSVLPDLVIQGLGVSLDRGLERGIEARCGAAMIPKMEDRLLMRPPSRARVCGRTSFTVRMTPKTLMSDSAWPA